MNEEEKKAVDKAIYELEDSYELHQREWAKKCLNTIKHGFTKLQKENEELKIKNNAIKRESEAYAEHMIRLDNELNLEKEKSKYEWIRQNCLSQELVNKLYIPIQKVKDNIEELKKNLYTVEHYETVGAINALQELLERRK